MSNNTPQKNEIRELFDATAYDKTGDKLGSIKEVFLDDRTGQPTFVEVSHGLFGMSSSLVPLRGSSLNGDSLNLGFGKDTIKDSPNIDAANGLSVDEEDNVYSHYGLTGEKDADYFHPDHHDTDQHVGERTDRNSDADHAAGADTAAATGLGAGAAAGKHRTDTSDTGERAADHDHTTAAAGTPAATGLGAGAPEGASRSDADSTVAGETAVDASQHVRDTDVNNTQARNDVVEGKAPGDFDRTQHHGSAGHTGTDAANAEDAQPRGDSLRLRKYVVRETETVEVPVEREEIRIEGAYSEGDTPRR